MQNPELDKARRRAMRALWWWKMIHFLFVIIMSAAGIGVAIMLMLVIAGWQSHESLRDSFVGAVVILGVCVLLATATIRPVERLKRRVNALTPESEG